MEIKNRKPDIRFLNDMKEVLFDEKWAKKAKNLELYYMYRGVKNKDSLRYDITVVPSLMLGKEFVKTKGHEHNEGFGEIYTVLKGEAIYLNQKCQGDIVKDVCAIKARKGESVIVPRGYGHISINPSKKELVEANWTDIDCRNIYGPFIKNKGACYYYTKSGWIKNKSYKKVPKLRFEKPLKKIPKNLSFLHEKN